LIAISYSRIAM